MFYSKDMCEIFHYKSLTEQTSRCPLKSILITLNTQKARKCNIFWPNNEASFFC